MSNASAISPIVLVADASAVVDGLLWPEHHPKTIARLAGDEDVLASPCLLDAEVLSALRRLERQDGLPGERAELALATLELLPIARYPCRSLTAEAWSLRHELTAYDALYVALARSHGARLLTSDARMARAARRLGVETA